MSLNRMNWDNCLIFTQWNSINPSQQTYPLTYKGYTGESAQATEMTARLLEFSGLTNIHL
jgi:hypothetical protein